MSDNQRWRGPRSESARSCSLPSAYWIPSDFVAGQMGFNDRKVQQRKRQDCRQRVPNGTTEKTCVPSPSAAGPTLSRPPNRARRSRMPIMPCEFGLCNLASATPTPLSSMLSRISDVSTVKATCTDVALACLATFVNDSWITRKSASDKSGSKSSRGSRTA